ncbi:hypothetical protein PROFUN_00424 [Planoprotostelium fungivorum]|uniref:UDP-glycosyltransferases domain-containing protein n=1 Tax=Planoprotostelium fungivorum TaxID=1890364 RepID=A0A2P6N0U0_9EUKA|nr:hypothetical protein PROFUN_00424 [Planoprotostelium fungivorum]
MASTYHIMMVPFSLGWSHLRQACCAAAKMILADPNIHITLFVTQDHYELVNVFRGAKIIAHSMQARQQTECAVEGPIPDRIRLLTREDYNMGVNRNLDEKSVDVPAFVQLMKDATVKIFREIHDGDGSFPAVDAIAYDGIQIPPAAELKAIKNVKIYRMWPSTATSLWAFLYEPNHPMSAPLASNVQAMIGPDAKPHEVEAAVVQAYCDVKGKEVTLPGCPTRYDYELLPANPPAFVCMVSYISQLFEEAFDGAIIYSQEEWEPEAFQALTKKGVSCFSLGAISSVHPVRGLDRALREPDQTAGDVQQSLNFLDAQLKQNGPKSLLYISFGSLFMHDSRTVNLIIDTLLNIEPPIPFLFSGKLNLPANTTERVQQSGRGEHSLEAPPVSHPSPGLIVPWVPQLAVLSHSVTAAMLSHGGFTTAQECFSLKVPLIICPYTADQPVVSLFLEGKLQVGVQLKQTATGPAKGRVMYENGRTIAATDDSIVEELRQIEGRILNSAVTSTSVKIFIQSLEPPRLLLGGILGWLPPPKPTLAILGHHSKPATSQQTCLILAAAATPAVHNQHDRRGLLDGLLGGNSGGLPIVGDLLGGKSGGLPIVGDLLGGQSGGLPIVGDLLGGQSGGLPIVGNLLGGQSGGLPIVGNLLGSNNGGKGNILTGLPIVGGLLGGLPIVGGLLGDTGLVGGILGSQGLVNNLLSGLLSGKGLVVATTYSTSIYVHANVAANIAIALPSTGGLLAPVQGILGSILPLGSLLGGILGTTTVLNVQAGVDMQVNVGVKANVQVALPAVGFAPIGTAGLIHGQVQVAICIDVSAEVATSVTLVTPVLNVGGLTSGTPGLVRVVNDVLSIVPSVFDKNTGRVVANLDPKAVSGTYMFVNIDIKL